MGKSSAPAAPDYASAANATAAGNLEAAKYTTQANRADQYTPYGSLTWAQGKNADGTDNNKWTQSVNLNSQGQELLDQQNKTSAGLSNLQDAATDRVGATMGSAIPDSYDPTKATNNASQLINERLAPQQARDKAALENQLANQGITQGSEAYTQAMESQGRTQNDAKQQAELSGINLGQSQQAQQYAQALSNRNLPMNELNAIRTGSQVSNPSFSNYSQQATTGGADMLGAANSSYNAALGGVNAANAGTGNLVNGLFSLGSAAMLSDMRLKTDISLVGKLDNGLNVYRYRYKSGGPMHIGVMAQEVKEVFPGAIRIIDGGMMAVDYGAI